MARHAQTRDDMTVRVLEWCGTYVPLLDLDEYSIEAAGGCPIEYLTILAEKEAEYCGVAHGEDGPEILDGFEDFSDMPLDFQV